jgi:hypothetical protein
MADEKYQSITVSTTVQTFSDKDAGQEFVFQCPSTNTLPVTVVPDGDTPVAGKGLVIEPGKDVPSCHLPLFMRKGPFKCIVSADTEVLIASFSKPRTPAS